MKEVKFFWPTVYKPNNEKLCAQILPEMLKNCVCWGWVGVQ